MLFDRINLDPKIQIQYVDSKNQLTDMLTKGSFTRDEWDHLLLLLNIMNFSMFSCSHFLSNRTQSVMSKRAQESTAQEGSAVAKPRPMKLVSRSAKKTPPQDSSASSSLGCQEFDQSFVTPSARKLVRNNNQDPTAHSQERGQDDTLSSFCPDRCECRVVPVTHGRARRRHGIGKRGQHPHHDRELHRLEPSGHWRYQFQWL